MASFEEKEYSKKMDFKIWLKIKEFVVPYKKLFITLIVLMLLIAVLDAGFPILIKYSIDNYAATNDSSGIFLISIIFLVIIIVQSINVKIFILISGKIECEVSYNIRKKLFKKLQQLDVSFFDKTPTGWILSRITSDIKKLGHTLSWHIVDLSWSGIMMILMLVFMLFLNWKLALIIFMLLPILVVISILFQIKILKNTRIIKKNNS